MDTSRRDEVDVLRGAALLGICVVNVPFLAGVDPLLPPSEPLDRAAAFVVAMFFQGKFFVLFSFLFGWGFGVQRSAARAPGRPAAIAFGARHARRLAALFVLGVGHALFVFTGDILVLYALLGALLWTLRDAEARRLTMIGAAVTGVAVVVLAGLAIVFSLLPATADADVPSGYLGSFADALRQRASEWPIAFGFVLAFNGPVAFAAFCGGLAAARCGFFDIGSASYHALRRRWPWLLVAGLVLNAAYASSTLGLLGDDLAGLAGFSALALGGPCLASVYLLGLVEATRRKPAVRSLRSAGRLSLSAYVAQGIVAGIVFNGYGFGAYGTFGDAACLGIALLVHAFVHLLYEAWSRTLGRGPLERLLRVAIGSGVRRSSL